MALLVAGIGSPTVVEVIFGDLSGQRLAAGGATESPFEGTLPVDRTYKFGSLSVPIRKMGSP